MILPVALISTCFLMAACLGSEETCHPLEDECETIILQQYFEKSQKKNAELLKCRKDYSELQKRHSDLQSGDPQNSKFQQGFLDLMKSHLELLSQLRESEVKYEQIINQKNEEIDRLRIQISYQKKTSDLSTLTHQFREDIAKLEKIVNIGGSDENNLPKAEVKTGKLQTTPLLNINNQTTSKTETIDFPDPCPQDQKEYKVLPKGFGWLRVFYKRTYSQTFNRTYEDYERGFGDVGTEGFDEFFIGLNRLHHLTSGKPHEVLIWTNSGNSRCENFAVGDRSEGYKVKSIGNCTGANIWMSPKQGSTFSTYDRDEDGVPGRNWAEELEFGWWFDRGMRPDDDMYIDMYIRRTN